MNTQPDSNPADQQVPAFATVPVPPLEKKKWWLSKTIWLAVLGLLVMIVGDPQLVAAIPAEWAVRFGMVSAVLAVVVRFLTAQPIA